MLTQATGIPEMPGSSPQKSCLPAVSAKDVIDMSEEEAAARRALQESMDLRDQGHADEPADRFS